MKTKLGKAISWGLAAVLCLSVPSALACGMQKGKMGKAGKRSAIRTPVVNPSSAAPAVTAG